MESTGSLLLAFGTIALIYWGFFKNNRLIQNLLLVVLNITFFLLIDWKFIIPVALVIVLNYFIGQGIGNLQSPGKKKLLLSLALVVYIGTFFFFRYLGVIVFRLNGLMHGSEISLAESLTDIAVPVGISIYLLNAMSYLIDVSNGKIKASKNFLALASYTSFAPTMLVGPIAKAHHSLPVFQEQRVFSKDLLSRGIRRMIWGIFKFTVIANDLAIYSNEVFDNYEIYKGLTIFAGLLCYTLQVYAFFSGLSDIAVGAGEILGIKTREKNFSFPFFSRNMLEFWSKWNVSLLEWLKEYILIPLSGSSGKKLRIFLALVLVFVFVGLWHGGSFSFLLFGFINALLIWPAFRKSGYTYPIESAKTKGAKEVLNFFIYVGIFLLTLLTLIFFRAESITQGIEIIRALLTDPTEISILELRSLGNSFELTMTHIIIVTIYIAIEYLQRTKDFPLDDTIIGKKTNVHWTLTVIAVIAILFFAGGSDQSMIFIY